MRAVLELVQLTAGLGWLCGAGSRNPCRKLTAAAWCEVTFRKVYEHQYCCVSRSSEQLCRDKQRAFR